MPRGARNFFGEGWPQHRWWGPLRPRWGPATLVTKTATYVPRRGNMPLKDGTTTPAERLPRCIRVDFRRGHVLNAVGLANPGLDALLADGRWRALPAPFVVSLAAVPDRSYSHPAQVDIMARMLRADMPAAARYGVELNLSCPNTGEAGDDRPEAQLAALRAVLGDGVPIVAKVSVADTVARVAQVLTHPAVDAIALSNTVPWGSPRVDWCGLFGDGPSPLAAFGGGGLSGRPLLDLVRFELRYLAGLGKPIIAGGGVLSRSDAHDLISAGASAIALGSVAILRPWRVRGIVDFVESRASGL